MATLTIADLDNGKRDLQTVDGVANSRAASVTTRYGQQTTTLYESIRRINATGDQQLAEQQASAEAIIRNLGYLVPVDYAPGLNVTEPNFTVIGPDGKIYAAQAGQLPFTTGAWIPEQWYPIQNDLNDHKLLVFETLAEAQAAAATLPDGQVVDVASEKKRYRVDAGALTFIENLEQLSFFDKFTPAQKADALSGFPVLDHTAPMQAAINAAAPGSTINGTPGATFNFKNLTSSKPLTLDFRGASLIVDPTPPGVTTGTPAIRFAGSKGVGYAINTKLDMSSSVTCTAAGDAANFAAGEWVIIEDKLIIQKWDGSGPGYDGRGQIVRVKSVVGGIVNLAQPVEHLYDGATAKIYKCTVVESGAKVLNIGRITEIDPGGITTGSVEIGAPHLIEFAYCIRPKVSAAASDGFNLFTVHFGYCVQPSLKRVSAINAFRPTNGGHGYLMRFYRCNGGIAQQSRGHKLRHVVDFTNTYDCISRDNLATEPKNVPFLWHGLASRRCSSTRDTCLAPTEYANSSNGWAIGNDSFAADYESRIESPTYRGGNDGITIYTLSDGVKITSPDIKITETTGSSPRGLLVERGAKNVYMSGGTVDVSGANNVSSNAVLVRDTSGIGTGDVVVQGTELIASAAGGPVAQSGQTGGGLIIDGCVLSGTGSGSNSAIQTLNAQKFLKITNNTVKGNWYAGIRVNNAPSNAYVVTGNIEAATITTGFTILATSPNLVAFLNGKSAANTFSLDASAGVNRQIELKTASLLRWVIRATATAEAGSNSGTDFELIRRADNGGALGSPLVIDRATGQVRFQDADVKIRGTWNFPLWFGASALWSTSAGVLRIKNGTPTSETDGTVVGTQT